MREMWKELKTHEVVERVALLAAVVVLLLDVFIWRP